MSDSRRLLTLRKEVLCARSTMLRLKVVSEVGALRASVRWPLAAAAVGGSAKVRSVLLGALLLLAGGKRVGRWLRGAAAVIAIAKLAQVALRAASHPEPTSAASSQSPDATS